ncbi:UDP-N-acetylglucosamine acyltransferase [Thalassospira sp. MBR-102]|jgi:UDP-N-acetylglucosamine acyltransferase|uniref:Acyl-[acyl-carrier-protein]--UDP-N-acetylglucosamine O-acyltransferase n=2 Tax=Thalassospira xiamenensis TaxID=220697 RepID=A0ABR5Y3R1_9PROT|nr:MULTISPECIES: acyl-ACP--UDP-N-acetylglucosamine O-acyltransferase [Thalassospira]MBR9780990.1 acyl-ACP--UDP-N-acetylglucosamine O-acyltransferase [Rhodospirillales bacterium]AJD52206.1 UDP-N-acetylglucosamine acyltransferase [Thalassospira xiamenensis M-5 = DSM 17429]KZD05035.1 acyl-[acyl-carrier-protein]--UDP-N-acetylglucosamine O-acyltransferase [Thalassospira xiamenensis]KZD11728.1 acyl-[acyl-carrier-protein]--UDP-N-acetylglucosamine O-acyltransferase [Thalassospira xiamenensis]MAB32167.|tara:strand:- start:2711 stop:3514 length:804 start_codon:yes stop_codon:yes gene_type:complete
MSKVHPTAIVEDGAQIGQDVEIGPYCVVGPQAVLGDRVKLHSHVVVAGITSIGEDSTIFPFASVGHAPQDLKFKNEPSRLIIGKRNKIREGATLNPGTEGGGMETTIGDDCLFMAGAHVGHDCHIGNHCILVNNGTLAGHVMVDDFAIVGGLSAVHQFVRIGKHAMIGGMTGVESDIIPYGSVIGNRAYLSGLNLVGLKRRGFDRETIHALRKAYRLLFAQEGTLAERVEEVSKDFEDVGPVMEIITFLKAESMRSVCTPKYDSSAG